MWHRSHRAFLHILPTLAAMMISTSPIRFTSPSLAVDFSHVQQLVVTETTNDIWNATLINSITPSTLMSWARAVIANRLSKRYSLYVFSC